MTSRQPILAPFWLGCLLAWALLALLLWVTPVTLEPGLPRLGFIPLLLAIAWLQYLLFFLESQRPGSYQPVFQAKPAGY